MLDVSRSMLAQPNLDSPQRIERAKAAASTLRASLSDVPVGLASLTDRVLPHLFPGTDQEVFAATLERSLGIEQPPPRASFATGATSLNALATLRGLRYFTPNSTKRLAIVLTDGESQPVSNARLGGLFRRSPAIEVVFVQFWDEDERVFSRGVPEPQYIAGPLGAPGARPARSLHARARSTRRTSSTQRRARRTTSSRAGRASSRGRRRVRSRSRRTSLPRRSFRSACSSGDAIGSDRVGQRVSTSSRNQGSTASGKPVSSMYEIARLASQRTASGLAVASTARTASSPPSGPPRSAGPRAAKPAQRRGRAVDVRSVLSVPLDADRAVEQREGTFLERSCILGSHEIAGTAPSRRSCLRDLHGLTLPPNENRSRTSQKYDPALDHGDGGIWIDGLWLVCRPTRQRAHRLGPRPW